MLFILELLQKPYVFVHLHFVFSVFFFFFVSIIIHLNLIHLQAEITLAIV